MKINYLYVNNLVNNYIIYQVILKKIRALKIKTVKKIWCLIDIISFWCDATIRFTNSTNGELQHWYKSFVIHQHTSHLTLFERYFLLLFYSQNFVYEQEMVAHSISYDYTMQSESTWPICAGMQDEHRRTL